MPLSSDRRRFIACILGQITLSGCCGPQITGSRQLLSRLARNSTETGLGVSVVASDAIYIRYLSDPAIRSDIAVPMMKTWGPVVLGDWGRVLIVNDKDDLRITELSGRTISEFPRSAGVQGCALNIRTKQLVFWGERVGDVVYIYYVADYENGHPQLIHQVNARSAQDRPGVIASFTDDAGLVRICVGFDTFLVKVDGTVTMHEPWGMQYVQTSPNGRYVAGREADGRVSIVDLKGMKRVTISTLIAGPCKWDPSSRYILADRKTNAPFWCQQTEFIILDAVTREVASIPAIIPDDWAHRYDWVVIPQSRKTPEGSAQHPR